MAWPMTRKVKAWSRVEGGGILYVWDARGWGLGCQSALLSRSVTRQVGEGQLSIALQMSVSLPLPSPAFPELSTGERRGREGMVTQLQPPSESQRQPCRREGQQPAGLARRRPAATQQGLGSPFVDRRVSGGSESESALGCRRRRESLARLRRGGGAREEAATRGRGEGAGTAPRPRAGAVCSRRSEEEEEGLQARRRSLREGLLDPGKWQGDALRPGGGGGALAAAAAASLPAGEGSRGPEEEAGAGGRCCRPAGPGLGGSDAAAGSAPGPCCCCEQEDGGGRQRSSERPGRGSGGGDGALEAP